MIEMKEPKIERRDFLKLSGGVAGLAVLGSKLLGKPKDALVETAKTGKAATEDGWYPGVCFMCTQSDCITRVHVVDGVVVKVEGNPKSITNKGTLCPRGNSAIMNLYNPWRVKAPLKRTNPKKALDEDPGFVEISWDEAFQTVADKMKEVLDDDPRKVSYVSGFGMRAELMGETGAFMGAYGTPNHIRSGGSACAYHFGCIYVHGQHPEAITDMDRCNYLLNIGRGLGPNTAVASSGTKITLDAIARGMKIVNVEPRCGPEVSKSTQWVPIKPGTDLAFALGLAHTILYEIGSFDVWFVKNRTNAPYLIGPDGEYVRDPESNKPLIWDEVEGQARTFDEIPPMNSALEGTFQVNGVDATPAFQLIKEAYKEYTPEWAEGISTVPAETIRTIANELVENAQIGATVEIDGFTFPYTPVSLQYQRGAYAHAIEGVFGDLVIKIIGSLLGTFDVPGGTSGNKLPGAYVLTPDEEGTVTITGEVVPTKWVWPPNAVDSQTFYQVSHTRCPMGLKAIIDPEKYHIPYETEVLVTCGGNYFYGGFDRKIAEAAYAKVPFSWVMSIVCDEPAVMSDIVFPDHSFMEREVHRTSANPHHVMENATRGSTLFYFRDASKITNPYNTMQAAYVYQELADRIGILPDFIKSINRPLSDEYKLDLNTRYTERDFGERWLKSSFGDEWSLADITADKAPPTKFDTRGAKNYLYYYWPDNKTRHPFYMIQLLRVGTQLRKDMEEAGLTAVPGWEGNMDFWWKAWQAIPVWVPCQEFDAPPEYDMWTCNWKTPASAFAVGDAPGNVWLHEVMSNFDPYEYAIWMNTETAKKKGIEDGDTIVVESRHGKMEGKVKVTQLIHPDTLGFPGYHGTRSILANPIAEDGPYFNALGSLDEQYAAMDPITGGMEQGWAVKVSKA